MPMPENPFHDALSSRRPQVGIWCSLASNYAAEVVAPAGFDWALIDMEHSPNEIPSVLGQLQAFAAYPTTAIVRPTHNDPVLVKRLLDLGAQGLLFPMVQSVEEAEQAVAAARYPPRGIRGVSGTTRANAFGRHKDYFDKVESRTTVIVQLETAEALDRADAIAAVDGVDAVFFGPADIAAAIGRLGQPLHEDVWNRVRPLARRLNEAGVAVGTLVQDTDFAAELFRDGFTFVACGQDNAMLARAADRLNEVVRQSLAKTETNT